MGYVKNTWVDQEVERPKTYEVTTNQDGSITLTDSFGLVTELGTPVNATNMNHIEDGLALTDATKYDATVTYNTGEWVTGVVDNKKGIYASLVDNNLGNALSDDTKWEEVKLGGGASRNIGEIVSSTIPLTDAGLHLLDGALIDGSGIYSAFVDYIASIYDASASYFTTEASWQDSVTNYGVCGKFVYDSVNNTVRLPKITGFVEGASGVTNLGGLTQAGLPNITGSVSALSSWTSSSINPQGAISASQALTNNLSGGNFIEYQWLINFDASSSSSIYGNSTTVQPQSIKVLYYIVVATSTKTDIQVDIDEIATDLNGKADVDLSNVSTSKGILTESYVNGSSWYRVYSDGWCEQGGYIGTITDTSATINLLKTYKDTNYSVLISTYSSAQNGHTGGATVNQKTVSSFTTGCFEYFAGGLFLIGDWQTSGYIR